MANSITGHGTSSSKNHQFTIFYQCVRMSTSRTLDTLVKTLLKKGILETNVVDTLESR